MSNKKQPYHPQKLKPLVQIVAGIVKNNPSIADDIEYLMATVAANIPGFSNKHKCLNCGASMAEYIFEFDVLDSLLLLRMAKEVRSRYEEYADFTVANRVRVQQIEGISYAIKSRTTQCSKLGLIAKLKGHNDKQVPGTWVITRRGWEALRGNPVPSAVKVFRGKILDRTETMITISEAFKQYGDKVAERVKNKKTPRSDYRDQTENYDAGDWVHIAGMHEGELI